MQGKQAKMVRPTQERAMLGYLDTTRSPARDRVMLLLSMKAGLRATAMASLTWAMVTDAQGQVAEVLHVPNRARKGKTGGRTMPLHPDLQAAWLVSLLSVSLANMWGFARVGPTRGCEAARETVPGYAGCPAWAEAP
jgi:hypothetical protein